MRTEAEFETGPLYFDIKLAKNCSMFTSITGYRQHDASEKNLCLQSYCVGGGTLRNKSCIQGYSS